MTNDVSDTLKKVEELLRRPTPKLDAGQLASFVQACLERREFFIQIRQKHGSPLYVIEEKVLLDRARRFLDAFRAELPGCKAYYAMKCNNCPAMTRILLKVGVGIDVSSGLELQTALDCGATDLIFSGPGKQEEELRLAVRHRDKLTVLLDSFAELGRLERIAAAEGATVRAGVRLSVDNQGLWRKFGIPLGELRRFFDLAEHCLHVNLDGLQFHTSWNLNPGNQVQFLRRLAETLRGMPPEQRSRIEFLDIGGGYWPPQGEWLQPAGTPQGQIRSAFSPVPELGPDHFFNSATPIEDYARSVAEVLRAEVFPLVSCQIWTEPGRWLATDCLSILVTVADRKADDLVITDAGTNAVGWERFEFDYFPVINLSRPALTERPCYVMGALCTPHDLWGYAYFGEDIQEGDVLLIPTQGAYTYSLRQQFIKPLPEVVVI